MKNVVFNNFVTVYPTYSSEEYDRRVIDCILYKKCLNKIPDTKWINMYKKLDKYKKNDMVVHKMSIYNTNLSKYS